MTFYRKSYSFCFCGKRPINCKFLMKYIFSLKTNSLCVFISLITSCTKKKFQAKLVEKKLSTRWLYSIALAVYKLLYLSYKIMIILCITHNNDNKNAFALYTIQFSKS